MHTERCHVLHYYLFMRTILKCVCDTKYMSELRAPFYIIHCEVILLFYGSIYIVATNNLQFNTNKYIHYPNALKALLQ